MLNKSISKLKKMFHYKIIFALLIEEGVLSVFILLKILNS